MTGYEHLVWAPAVGSIAFFGHRVAIRWLDSRERANVAAEARQERESGVNARCDEMERELKAMKVRVETFIANNGVRR